MPASLIQLPGKAFPASLSCPPRIQSGLWHIFSQVPGPHNGVFWVKPVSSHYQGSVNLAHAAMQSAHIVTGSLEWHVFGSGLYGRII